MPASLDVLRGASVIAAIMDTTPKRIYTLKAQGQFPLFVEDIIDCVDLASGRLFFFKLDLSPLFKIWIIVPIDNHARTSYVA